MTIRHVLALTLLLCPAWTAAQTEPPGSSTDQAADTADKQPQAAGKSQRVSTSVICAANTADVHGCDFKARGSSDQMVINAAISACSKANGCKIILRDGTYNISASIVIDRSYVTLEGESWPFWGAYVRGWTNNANPVSAAGTQGALIQASAAGFNLIEIQHHNLPDNAEKRHRGIRIANLYLVGNAYSGNCVDSLTGGNFQDDSGDFESLTLTRCAYGLYISVDNGYIEKNNMQDLSAGGAFISGVNSRFTNNIVWDVGGRGLETTVRGLTVVGNTFGNTYFYSIDAEGPGVAVITGNAFGPTSASTSANAIYLACSGCVVSGNYFDETAGSFRTAKRTTAVVKVANAAATNNTITGNSFIPAGIEPAGVYAIDLTASTGNVVIGNSITPGFNKGSAAAINPGVGNIVALNRGDVTATAQGEQTIDFQTGPLAAVTNTKGGFSRFAKSSTIDNIEASATALACSVKPTVTLYECGTSSTCANPVIIGSATVSATGTVVDGTVLNTAIAAGDYVAWALSAGTCSGLSISATAQLHSN
jgi:hypothetical protein